MDPARMALIVEPGAGWSTRGRIFPVRTVCGRGETIHYTREMCFCTTAMCVAWMGHILVGDFTHTRYMQQLHYSQEGAQHGAVGL